jgi:hypothetical protein
MDHLNVPWDKFYMIEPHLGIVDATKQELIICGKVAWYMDHLNVPWAKFYMIEPHLGIMDATKQELVICGKVCIWR